MSGAPMTEEEFTDELDELVEAGRDGGLSDEDMIVLLERVTRTREREWNRTAARYIKGI